MRFVDEYRDGALARRLSREIAALVEPGEPVRIMEVCGGHTHAIAKHGLEDLLPPEVEYLHGPGCPVCVIPMGRVDDAIALAERPEVTLATFGDMLRVPGGRGTLLEAKARGADVRMVYSPLDALAIAQAEPDREVVFLAIGFETTAPATAVTLHPRPRRRSPQLRRVLQPRHDRPAARGDPRHAGHPHRRLHRAGPRLDRDRHRAVPLHRRGVRQAGRRRGVRAARPPPVDRDDPAPAPRGTLRGREPVHAGRPGGGQPARARGDRGDDGAARDVRVARARLDPVERACRSAPPSPTGTPRRASSSRGARVADPKACQCGEVLVGAIKPWQCKVFGTACTPERPLGTCMVSSEGACAAYYSYGRHAA